MSHEGLAPQQNFAERGKKIPVGKKNPVGKKIPVEKKSGKK
jgi:hypothetical protein